MDMFSEDMFAEDFASPTGGGNKIIQNQVETYPLIDWLIWLIETINWLIAWNYSLDYFKTIV